MQRLYSILFLAALCAAGCAPTKEDYRNDFVKGCVNRFAKDSTVASTEGRKWVEDFCNCVGDQLNTQMDAGQWRLFNKSGDTSLSQFHAYIETCINNFNKNKLNPVK